MDTTLPISNSLKFWKTVLPYGLLYFLIMFLGFAVVEPFSGGCMFIIPAYFMVLIVALPILMLRRFGAGMAVFIPYAVVGFFMDYYYEVVQEKSLTIWGVVGWCLMGVVVGLSGDLAYRFLPRLIVERWRAVLVGAVIGLLFFLTTLAALASFYSTPSMETHYRFFTQGIYFSLPWLVANGGLAGYTAYAMTRDSR